MPLLYLLLPGGFLLWLFKKYSEHNAGPTPPARAEVVQTTESSVASYIAHLDARAAQARAFDEIKPYAQAGDADAIMQAPPGVLAALRALAAPVDALTLQRDLNVLGSTPALRETGSLDRATREAVKAVQRSFGQVPSGQLDSDARVAIAYAVGCIHAQRCGCSP